ncbi:preprotein translocase subunit SecG [Hypericibacter sp.]|uniref:preprotein translocase subunit SecG n=1 Tax=Hypericibacter sp. TaxID=2705401 RepID=UPI003D6D4832
MQQVVLVIHLMLAVALIAVVLMQRSEGGGIGLGTAGSGGMGGFLSGRGQANLLTRTTAIIAGCFIATSILLALLARHGTGPVSIFEQTTAPATQEAPLQPTDSGTTTPTTPTAPSVPLGQQ